MKVDVDDNLFMQKRMVLSLMGQGVQHQIECMKMVAKCAEIIARDIEQAGKDEHEIQHESCPIHDSD